jgi:hypothetical protein
MLTVLGAAVMAARLLVAGSARKQQSSSLE